MLPDSEKFVNIHAHRLSSSPEEWVLTNLFAKDYPPQGDEEAQYSVGFHPWNIDKYDVGQMLRKVQLATENPKVFAIGEVGLDKAIQTPIKLQQEVFEVQVELAEQHDLAIIIHAVKSFNELIEFRRVHQPVAPMIIHGYSGSVQMAEDLVKEGFYLSLGHKLLDSETLQKVAEEIPLRKLFLESDEADVSIQTLYKKLGEILETPVDFLKVKISDNLGRVFPRYTEY